jgi:membrane fusion protein (multidrug efflux system)
VANSFSRTTRSLSADGHSTTLIGLLVVLLLLVIWGAWFFAAGVPIRHTSASAEVTSPQRVTAVFPSDSSVGINRGQAVNFHPAGNIGAQIGAIPGIVSRVSDDPSGDLTFVEIALRFEQALPAPLQEGLKGQVDIELERVSPATLILRSAGMVNKANAQGPGLANN